MHVGGLGGGRGCSLNEMPRPCDCQIRKAGVREAGGGGCGPGWAAVRPCPVLCDSPALRLLTEGEPRGPLGTASERPPRLPGAGDRAQERPPCISGRTCGPQPRV